MTKPGPTSITIDSVWAVPIKNILCQSEDTLAEVVTVLQQVISRQIMLNSALMIMIMMFGMIIVRFALDLGRDSGTITVWILIPTTNLLCLIGQQQYLTWRWKSVRKTAQCRNLIVHNSRISIILDLYCISIRIYSLRLILIMS